MESSDLSGAFDLTDREAAIAGALYDGETEQQAAARLRLSPHTVHGHVKSIYRKLGAHDRAGMVRVIAETIYNRDGQEQRGRGDSQKNP